MLHPDAIPAPLRRLGRVVLPARLQGKVAAGLQDLANLRYRFRAGSAQNRDALLAMRDTHRGETCVIMGNGPSMRDFDLRRLDGVDVFCLNRGYLLWNKAGLTPRYLMVTNTLVIEQFADELRAIGAMRFMPWEAADAFDGTETRFFASSWRPGFRIDITRGIWGGGTVTFGAMQIAYFLGYRRVVLIGVDHSFVFEGKPNDLLHATGADVNHFDPSYFGPGVRWHAPNLPLSEFAYGLAKQTYLADHREIIDATEGGQLQVFEKMPLERALAGGKVLAP